MPSADRFSLLVVDDDAAIRRQLHAVLEDEGHRVTEAASAAEGFEALGRERFDAVLLDLRMPGEHGLDALIRFREHSPDTAVLIVSGEGTVENAIKAGQRGAFDFIEKPIRDPERLLDTIAQAVRVTRLRRSDGIAAGAGAPEIDDGDLGIVGRSAPVEKLREQVRRIAPSSGRVLVTGENGAGKELVAHAIHRLSKRANGPFVKLNCAAIPRDLLESELFGYEKGAFTGAVQSKKGRLEQADGGTLFLDEIGDLAIEAQAKLLRAIETGEIERVGGTRSAQLDVRLVAATNKDLAEEVKAGEFREDLYFRLNVLPIVVPPLRERRGDIGRLAIHFLAAFSAAEARANMQLTPDAIELLEDYHWPGNVRELRNLMERAVVLAPSEAVDAADLLPWLEARPEDTDDSGLKGKIARSEVDSIRRALESADWNVTQAAASLGIDRTNLHRKMRKYGIARR
ncbi:MAG: sigma-54-dependent Fis family transcriptional regulator [Candidatus Eisenbacteria bacterium]|nr:sigma-54-dependent Fis family transcriptional regulator [Candidatus Eisenbacteria bacterium]